MNTVDKSKNIERKENNQDVNSRTADSGSEHKHGTIVFRGSSNLTVGDSDIFRTPEYLDRVTYAFKLGFSEAQLKIALSQLGTATPKDNDLLQELIKLGTIGKSIDEESDLEEEDVFDDNDEFLQPKVMEKLKDAGSNLRTIVIDGSNVAMSHGNKETFSCYGIQLAVDYFRNRGHSDVVVFVPQWRKETPRADSPIKNQEVLFELEKEKLLVYTPSRRVAGKRVVCYDDRYVIKLAADTDGVVVSNDNYRDLINEEPSFRKVIEERLLMYSFVNDRFMPPADPLGRHGPTLDNFLLKEPTLPETLPPICPYLKKCTYGNKCKFYHPERGNKPQKLITEKLAEEAQLKMIEVKERQLSEQSDDSKEGKTRLKSSKDDIKPSMEDKERQRKQNELLDHYRKQVEESERKPALVHSRSPGEQDNESLPVIFPPSHSSGRYSDGTHSSVARTLSDQNSFLTQRMPHTKVQRRQSVPSEQLGREVESMRRQLSRQASLTIQPGYESRTPSAWSTYPGGPESIDVHCPPPQPPAPAPMQTFPPTRADIGYRQPLRADPAYHPRYQEYQSANLQNPMQGIHPASMSYPHPAGRHNPNFQPSFPPMVHYSPWDMQGVQHSVPNLSQRWVPASGYNGHMYPELPDQNVAPISYSTGPPVENEVIDYRIEPQQGVQYQAMPTDNRYGASASVSDNVRKEVIPAPCQISEPQRYAIYVNLSNIYGEETVRKVMHQYPKEVQAHVIAAYAAQPPAPRT